jgi:DNA-binding response OmpR family regulator
MRGGALALVVAPQGRLSDSWRALLLATPQIVHVQQVHGASSIPKSVEVLAPDLVLLDAESFGMRAWTVLNQIKETCAHCCCIVLICNARYRQQALDAGADEVLLKGFPADQLSAAIERLLSRSKCDQKEE